jgi:hypothetical protein
MSAFFQRSTRPVTGRHISRSQDSVLSWRVETPLRAILCHGVHGRTALPGRLWRQEQNETIRAIGSYHRRGLRPGWVSDPPQPKMLVNMALSVCPANIETLGIVIPVEI